MTVPFRVKALYEYSSPHEDDLNFPLGQVITVTEEEDDDWYGGEYLDDNGSKKEGIFPRNFVEKIEPTAPPRPTRTRHKKETEDASSAPTAEKPVSVNEPEAEPQETVKSEQEPVESVRPALVIPTSATIKSAESPSTTSPIASAPSAAPKPVEATAAKPKPGPAPSSDKPASNSFKDRIAAFNKPAAPPVAPFKPASLGGSGGTGFVKKPFVAPPPSRNAYVPPPREQPTTNLYRRDEDPEIREREAETQDQAERAGLVPDQPQQGSEDDQPKPTSLKERIALLQKQQMEQAQRHADAAAKKDKPKKPPKKRVEGATQGEVSTEAGDGPLSPTLERSETGESVTRASIDDTTAPLQRRRPSKGPVADESHDGNEADLSGAGDTTEGQDDTTEREDEDISQYVSRMPPAASTITPTSPSQHDQEKTEAQGGQEGEEEEEEEQEEEDVDPEVRRKEELRARMAKMSGGMGFHGMFGAPMPSISKAPTKKKAPKAAEAAGDEVAEEMVSRAAPPIPTPMALPGMGNSLTSSQGKDQEEEDDEYDGDEATPVPTRTMPPPVPARAPAVNEHNDHDGGAEGLAATSVSEAGAPRQLGGPPPLPGGRPAPPPVPTESRAPPQPPPPAGLKSATDGSESDDELSGKDKDVARSPPMPPQSAPGLPLTSPPQSPRTDEFSPSSPPTGPTKRNSRPPPPIPGTAPMLPPASSRPPPPPPPGSLSRRSTADVPVVTPTRPPQAGEDDDEEITEYEGDYDTDIASSVPHKDALKSHARESSAEDNTLQSPTRDVPPIFPPPVPAGAAPRAVPPPIPAHAPPEGKRTSVDVPRAAPPPPPPPAKDPAGPAGAVAGDYDPFNYSSPPPVPPPGSSFSHRTPKIDEEQVYFPGPQVAAATSPPPPERRAPPSAPSAARSGSRPSIDMPRTSTTTRRSMDMHRPSVDSDFIANDVDLAMQSGWWKQANQVPPVFQGRKDIHYESEETTTTNQGSKTVVTRDVFVLFQDYSQTVLTVQFDPYNASDVELTQRHEPPPRALRQDQMEEFYERFGRQVSEAATSKKDTVVSDGTPQGFVMEMLRPLSGALPPVGTRSYGALVYANMANASTQQQDVIRAGDIISFRNAKFQGKHGPMHAKYSAEVGKPDHVAVVAEWDGTKKKVRAWEQGRENKKVKMESYKLDDLRSGEVKIWRVVPRTWVGWNVQS